MLASSLAALAGFSPVAAVSASPTAGHPALACSLSCLRHCVGSLWVMDTREEPGAVPKEPWSQTKARGEWQTTDVGLY